MTAPRRVLIVTTWYPSPEAPGQAPFCRAHARLIAQDAQVKVLHFRLGSALPDADETDGPIAVHHRSLAAGDPASLLRARRELARYQRGATLVHTMAFSAALIQALCLPRAPWVHTEHWSGVRDPATVAGRWRQVAFLRHVLRLPDAVTGVSAELTEILTRFARPGVCSQVPVPVSVPGEPAPIPAGPALPMIAVGHLIEGKDPLCAVRALALVRERGIDARLTWLGEGPLREHALAEAARLKVAGQLELAGSVPHDQVGPLMSRARLFFLPTRFENFLTSAAEALAQGRPVVVGANGGHREYIDEDNGVLVARQDPAAYADAIEAAYRGLEAGRYDSFAISSEIDQRYGPGAVTSAIGRAYEGARIERARGARLARAAHSLLTSALSLTRRAGTPVAEGAPGGLGPGGARR